jgi:hypothetical protein
VNEGADLKDKEEKLEELKTDIISYINGAANSDLEEQFNVKVLAEIKSKVKEEEYQDFLHAFRY